MFDSFVLQEFQAKMLVLKSFPIVLSQDVCLLLNIWSKCVRYECHLCPCDILCGHYSVYHQINNSCRTRLPRINYKQAKFLCSQNFRGSSAPGAKDCLVGKGLTIWSPTEISD